VRRDKLILVTPKCFFLFGCNPYTGPRSSGQQRSQWNPAALIACLEHAATGWYRL